MKDVTLNGAEIETKEQLHELLARSLAFPDYYGHNLDALYDCLTEKSEPVTLTLTHTEALGEHLGTRYTASLLRLLTRAAAEHSCITVCIFPQEGC